VREKRERDYFYPSNYEVMNRRMRRGRVRLRLVVGGFCTGVTI